ncbi:MAG: L-idonate 5-dehydrogenase [Pseudomonadota bacterium]|jgi:L-idonate 5-dehydrogenase|nr:L-idonate 5-dehydrogenase [Pseudomonadota bacterium]HEV2039227.1 L-idonate 5-dehydrogenase [Casimicrobiaceae bacterium]
MLACRIHAKDDLRIEAAEDPQIGPGQVLIRLGAGGICGSDLHYYFEGRNGSFVIREPLIPGHEASGVVAKVGPGVTRVKPGDKIAVSPSHACGHCDYCREGREHLCRNMRFLGSASLYPHVQGMFCEYFVMGERQCYPVAGDISLGELAFAEPLAVALHAVNRGPVLMGKSVLITGAGTIGCLTVIAARLAGARQITVSDVLDRPLATATEVGADRTIRADRDADALAAPQFDVAYEVSGSFAALKACVAAVKRGGTVVQVGTLPHEPLPFVVNEIMGKELDLKGAFRWGIEFDWAVDYLSSRRVDVRPLLSGQFPLQDAVKAFELAKDKTRSTKVQVIAA